MNPVTAKRLAAAAGVIFACAVFALGARWPGYSHLQHPVALAGAAGLPGALLFNAMVYVLPGALVAVVALSLHAALPAATGWWPRIGANLLLLSALAFVAQGMLPLDAGDLDASRSRRHAAAWTAWMIAFAVGAPMFSQSLASPSARMVVRATGMAIVLMAVFGATLVPEGLAQRIAFAAWFAWCWGAARAISRAAASGPG